MLPITVIIVTYNSADVILPCIGSIINDAARVIIVDNNSTDHTYSAVREAFPKVEHLKNKENEGFGRANNRALAATTTPFALLLNPDAVLSPGTLEKLVQAAGHYPDAAILAPRILDAQGTTQHSYKPAIFDREMMRFPSPLAEGDICAGFLSGAVMLLNITHFQKTGFFDPHIFLYYEDDDLCIRARQAGFGLVWVHDATATHLCGKSSPATTRSLYRKNMHMIWSRIYLEQKYRGQCAALLLRLRLIGLYSAKTLLYCLVANKERIIRSLARLIGALG